MPWPMLMITIPGSRPTKPLLPGRARYIRPMPSAPSSKPLTRVARKPTRSRARSATQIPAVHSRVEGRNASPLCNTLN